MNTSVHLDIRLCIHLCLTLFFAAIFHPFTNSSSSSISRFFLGGAGARRPGSSPALRISRHSPLDSVVCPCCFSAELGRDGPAARQRCVPPAHRLSTLLSTTLFPLVLHCWNCLSSFPSLLLTNPLRQCCCWYCSCCCAVLMWCGVMWCGVVVNLCI